MGNRIGRQKTRNLCKFTVSGGEFTGYFRFPEEFCALADIPTIVQERNDKTFEHKHPAWLDDMTIVTERDIKKHETENMN